MTLRPMTRAQCEDAVLVARKARVDAQRSLRRAERMALRAEPRFAALANSTVRAARLWLAHAWIDERGWIRAAKEAK